MTSSFNAHAPVALTQQLINCPSVTPHHKGTLDILTHELQQLGFVCQRLIFDDVGSEPVENLYAARGTQVQPHFCFAGHVDVVPAGDVDAWQYQPFQSTQSNGFVYGRGAVDMKGAIAAFVCAVRGYLDEHVLNGTISLLITADEEGVAINGTRKVLQWLKAQHINIDFCLVGEPSSQQVLGDTIKVGRRGSLNTLLTIFGEQGHVANHQAAHNPMPALLKCLNIIDVGPVESVDEKFDATNVEITSIDVGNTAVNIIPNKAQARFNIRFNTQHTGESLMTWIRQICTLHGGRHKLEFSLSGDADYVESPAHTGLVQNVVRDLTGLLPELSTAGGTSDARFIRNIAPVLEFGLVNQTMHQINECVKIDDLTLLTRIYQEILTRYFTSSEI